MYTIKEVRTAEKKMRELMYELRRGGAADPDLLQEQLRKATDDYARAVRELRPT